MAKLMEDEKAMLPDDGVSPIDSENKYFFLDFFGLKRNHIRFLNFFKHANLFDIEKPNYSSTKVWNREPTLYKESLDEFGHVLDIIEIPPCIFIEEDEELMNLMKVSDGKYKFPSSLNSTVYNKFASEGKILTNLIYLISKSTTETTITDKNGNVFDNATNGYYEYIITSIKYNDSTGMYDLKWEMLGGREGEGSTTSSIALSETVVVETLPAESKATANIKEYIKTETLTTYQLHLGIPVGKDGTNGTNGTDGKEIELQVADTYIQWKYTSDSNWNNLIELNSLKGPKGDKGDKGEDGTSVNIKNTLSSTDDLPTEGNENGDAYLINGYLWVYTGTSVSDDNNIKGFTNVGNIQGPKGEQGEKGDPGKDGVDGTNGKSAYEIAKETGYDGSEEDWISSLKGKDGTNGTNGTDGKEVELQVTDTYIQWRYAGEGTWKDLLALTAITGPKGEQGDPGTNGKDGTNGKEIELNVSETHIQWRYIGSEDWINLIELSSLKGSQGEKGDKGDQGEPGKDGTNGKDGETPDMSNYLAKNNTAEYIPSNDYNPCTKKYVDDLIGDINTILSSLTTV